MAAETRNSGAFFAALVIGGLVLGACGDKAGDQWLNGDFDDTGSDTGGDPGVDNDNDGFGQDEDCRDNDPDSYPGADEIACDGIDQDCDGEDLLDGDGDGHDCPAYGGDDCDDSDASISPSATEIWYDSIDQDCDDNDTDADEDGYVGDSVGGDDCADDDPSINPGVEEGCYDDVDNDCSTLTDDCDCDGDGVDGETCGGADCDDEDPTVDGTGTEYVVDGLDNDCDEEIDEDAYCNIYFPLSMETGHELDYESTGASGTVYTELWSIDTYSSTTGNAVVRRDFSDSSGNAFTSKEDINCDTDGTITMSGWDMEYGGSPFASIAFSATRQILAAEGDLTAGTSWEFDYSASDSSLGDMWDVSGTVTVSGEQTVTVTAGMFTALKLEIAYSLTDNSSYVGSRDGTIAAFWTKKLGLVYSEDYDSSGSLAELRELTAYYGYYPD